jgi:hypothetical protein
MIFESRDSAGKIAPVSTNTHAGAQDVPTGPIKVIRVLSHGRERKALIDETDLHATSYWFGDVEKNRFFSRNVP